MSKSDVVSKFAHVAVAEEIYNETIKDLREGLLELMRDRSVSEDDKHLLDAAYSGVRFANAVARHGPAHPIARRIRLELRSAIQRFYYPPSRLERQRKGVDAARHKKRLRGEGKGD
jgi:hypothetical protein